MKPRRNVRNTPTPRRRITTRGIVSPPTFRPKFQTIFSSQRTICSSHRMRAELDCLEGLGGSATRIVVVGTETSGEVGAAALKTGPNIKAASYHRKQRTG